MHLHRSYRKVYRQNHLFLQSHLYQELYLRRSAQAKSQEARCPLLEKA